MIYKSETIEQQAAMRVAELMAAAARTAPKACAIDAIETLVLDGADKDRLTAEMRKLTEEIGAHYYARDAANLDACHNLILIGVRPAPRNLNCGLCGVETCAEAVKQQRPCALAVTDLGIAVGSAAAIAMDHRVDNRILFTAGMAALRQKLFSDEVTICYGIGLAVTGKNVFFDRMERKRTAE
ncbi:MAG: DUF2148 domain-containing protein [Oscillospiraceae bacterium]|nr:DUF2148 domain-containing protein [Oscillospiraceae bacterium]